MQPSGKSELSEQTRQPVDDYLKAANKRPGEFLFTGRRGANGSMTTRQYARLIFEWIGTASLMLYQSSKPSSSLFDAIAVARCRNFGAC